MSTENYRAFFVTDTATDVVNIPPCMGQPRADQMQGTKAEQLVELAGRVCYDSLGKGRSSADYLKHLLDVGHYSVHEHVHFTWTAEIRTPEKLIDLIGIPDLTCRYVGETAHFTWNLRHCVDKSYTQNTPWIWPALWRAACSAVPQLLPKQTPFKFEAPVLPTFETEKFISMYLRGSRVFSHEMVRHRNNISQRSGRYCDESETEILDHPLMQAVLAENEDSHFEDLHRELEHDCRRFYGMVLSRCESFIKDKGVDALTARKQARSAARFYLPNGLETEMIYTASVKNWKHIFHQRLNPAADAEIRLVMAETLKAMKEHSPYGSSFDDFNLKPSPDGLGEVLV